MRVVDLFSGAGGSTLGATMAGHTVVACANHWDVAVATHAANHPTAQHICQDVGLMDRPILFSAPMVRAILSGAKTQTRRIIKPTSREADGVGVYSGGGALAEVVNTFEGEPFDAPPISCPYGIPGDRLWVRETFAIVPWLSGADVRSPADPDDGARMRATWDRSHSGHWRPSIHMPRWASRITLEITGVRVERLQEISEADARAEGVEHSDAFMLRTNDQGPPTMREKFAALWQEVYGPESWDRNEWVWAITFRRIEQ